MPKKRSDIDWLNVLDIERAISNLEVEFRGDWYRDPWGWPEMAWTLKRAPATFADRLSSRGAMRCVPIDVPKENFAARPAVVLDPIDRVCYQALVDHLSPRLIGEQPNWVYGWRLPPGDGLVAGHYARNDYQWANFRSQLAGLTGLFDHGLKTDVVSFFANVDIERLSESIFRRSGSGKVPNRLVDYLYGWDRVPTRPGLPQRSSASAVLANMYLQPVDDVLRAHGAVDGQWRKLFAPNGAACRWMDDIWLFGANAGVLRGAQLDIQAGLRDLGLEMNFAKTDVLEGEELVEDALQLEHSAVDAGLSGDQLDESPLNELLDALLACPEHASRTSIRFAATRMREHKKTGRLSELVDSAHRMPHGADHLARLFRETEAWRDLPGWYLDYTKTDWARLEWPVALLATMFPSSERVSSLCDHFGHLVASGSASLPLLSVAIQRLAAWDAAKARQAAQEASRTSDHPLARRSLALASIGAGQERHVVRKLLGEFEENAQTLAMLEATNWTAPKLVADFAA